MWSRVLPLALAAATEALQTAGIDAASLSLEQKRRFGVILGSGGGCRNSRKNNTACFSSAIQADEPVLRAHRRDGDLSSELSVRFGLRGPSHVITTGCTSSTDGFGYSVRQIQSGRLDRVLAEGRTLPSRWASSRVHPDEDSYRLLESCAGTRLATVLCGPRRLCGGRRSLDVLLEEYEHARARGAKMLAEISGYGSTCEAFHRVRLQECGEEPARAIGLAMKEAESGRGMCIRESAWDLDQLNDRIETRALKWCWANTQGRCPCRH